MAVVFAVEILDNMNSEGSNRKLKVPGSSLKLVF